MQVKKVIDHRLVARILGKTSLEISDKCPDRMMVFPRTPCSNIGCEFAIRQPGYMNCTFVAAEAGGEHSLESIGEMMDITREGVRQIEVRAMRKLRAALEKQRDLDNENIAALLQPSLATGPDRIETIRSSAKSKHRRDKLRACNDRKLGELVG